MAWRFSLSLTIAVVLAVPPPAGAQQDTLDVAKALYGSAAYDEALAMLERLDSGSVEEVGIEVSLYRMFCLLVLDRKDEADLVIDEMVTADPFYVPATDKTSPRIRGIFEEGRRAVLPRVAWRMYATARAAFGEKEEGTAAQFERLVALLDDPVLAADPAFADLRILAAGFRDLASASSEVHETAAAFSAAPVPVRAEASMPDQLQTNSLEPTPQSDSPQDPPTITMPRAR